MSPLPSADRELAELERFLAHEVPPPQADDPKLQLLRQKAERLAIRLANPVRVAIVGLPGRGKSALANFLAGQSFETASSETGLAYPVILRFGERPTSFAGWWSGIEIAQTGVDIAGAAALKPDYIELRLQNPVLKFLSFLDLPGQREWERQKEQMRWISGRADVLIWCTDASNPWTDDEWQLWALVPRRLKDRSILVATNLDHPAVAKADPPVDEWLTNLTGSQFQEVVAIATLAALSAAPSGGVTDPTLWEKSGGRAMVGALLTAARAVRRTDIAIARDLLATALEDVDGLNLEEPPPAKAPPPAERAATPPKPAPAPKAEPKAKAAPPEGTKDKTGPEADAAPPEPDETQAPAAEPSNVPVVPTRPRKPVVAFDLEPGHPDAEPESPEAEPEPSDVVPELLTHLDRRIGELVDYATSEGDFKDWEFMTRITEIGDDISIRIASAGALTEAGSWVRPQIEEAFVTLSLLQMEHGDRPARDAATVVLQLARDLAWAASAKAD